MLHSFVEVSKLDHLLFKFKVYESVSGSSHGHSHVVGDPHQCRFGRWYYDGEGQAQMGKHPAYREMETPHNEIHQAGMAAINAASAGQKPQVLDALNRMEQTSMKMVAILDRIAS
ncbi:CZB domain-containing protein [Chitinibacter fontanus]|nr:CZB domain-containing protein [Chitinibacter fontanus]